MVFPGTKFHVTKLNINIPNPLECLFALVKPINNQGGKLFSSLFLRSAKIYKELTTSIPDNYGDQPAALSAQWM